MKARNRDSRRF